MVVNNGLSRLLIDIAELNVSFDKEVPLCMESVKGYGIYNCSFKNDIVTCSMTMQ